MLFQQLQIYRVLIFSDIFCLSLLAGIPAAVSLVGTVSMLSQQEVAADSCQVE